MGFNYASILMKFWQHTKLYCQIFIDINHNGDEITCDCCRYGPTQFVSGRKWDEGGLFLKWKKLWWKIKWNGRAYFCLCDQAGQSCSQLQSSVLFFTTLTSGWANDLGIVEWGQRWPGHPHTSKTESISSTESTCGYPHVSTEKLW